MFAIASGSVAAQQHRYLAVPAAAAHSGYRNIVDLAARTIAEPTELPLSIVTAVFGVPFFLWLLRRRSPDRAASLA